MIDNFEHLLDAAELVGELHAACPRVAILTTSREPLNLAAEHRVFIPPLPVPAVSGSTTMAEIEAFEASALFLSAVRRRDNQFALTPANAQAVARICRMLDGLPLALELAAARTGLLTVEELADRLDQATTDLGVGSRDAPARQRTLKATIDWSYHLLDENQQRAFARFAVFAGGATVAAAQAVTGASVETLEALAAKSLIERRTQPDESARLVMLQTIREYALDRLATDAARKTAEERHFEHYLQLVEQASAQLSTREERRGLARIDLEIDNILSALQWAIQARPTKSLRLAGQLGLYWWIRGESQSLSWLDAALQVAGEQAPLADRARAQLFRGRLLVLFGRRPTAARDAADKALVLFQEAGDHLGVAEALCDLSNRAAEAGEPDRQASYAESASREARLADDRALLGRAMARQAVCLPPSARVSALEDAAKLLAEAGDYRVLAGAYYIAAYFALLEDRPGEAMRLLDLARPAADLIDSPLTGMFISGNIGLSALFTGDVPGARDAFRDQLLLCQRHAFRYGAGEGLIGFAAVAAHMELAERAAQLLGAARALGYPIAGDEPIADRLERQYFAPLRTRCREDRWRKDEQIGATLTYDQAIELALQSDIEEREPGADVELSAAPIVPLRVEASRQRRGA